VVGGDIIIYNNNIKIGRQPKKWSGGRNENSLEICSVFNAGYHYFYLIHANVLYWEKKLVHGGPQNDTDAISTELKLV